MRTTAENHKTVVKPKRPEKPKRARAMLPKPAKQMARPHKHK